MMNVLKFALTICLLVIASPAYAEPVIYFNEPVPPDLVRWVEEHMDVHLPPQQQLSVIDNSSPLFEHKRNGDVGISFAEPAVESDGKIYIPVRTAVHLQEESYRALIVHELTHIAQHLNKHHYACPGQYEAEAYQMQNTYLLEHDQATVIQADQLQQLQNCADGASKAVRTGF